jgi:ABC-type dipeptide/oligopeptide/nickel transport system permease subunit
MVRFSARRRVWRSAAIWFSLVVILIMGLVAAFAPQIAPHDPYRMDAARSNLPPAWVQDRHIRGLAEFPLGTDRYGRDVLSRLIFGTRTAFCLALLAVPLAALIGTLAGLVAGYAGGRLDQWIMLVTDMVSALPGIMFLVIIVLIFRSLLTPSWFHGLIALVIGFAAISWVGLARLIRINILQIRSRLFVEAAISIGATSRRIVLRHLLPNVLHVILVWVVNNIPAVILIEAVLGYVGVGITREIDGSEFSVVSWGGMFYAGRSALSRNPLMLLLPSLCVLLISMSFVLLADFLSGITRQE